jgi:hypothetical protein
LNLIEHDLFYFNEYFKLFHLKKVEITFIVRLRDEGPSLNLTTTNWLLILQQFHICLILCTPNFANYWTLWALLALHNKEEGRGGCCTFASSRRRLSENKPLIQTQLTKLLPQNFEDVVVSWNQISARLCD